MASSPVAPQPAPTPQPVVDLDAKIAAAVATALAAQKPAVTVSAPPIFWQKTTAWVKSKGGWAHAAVIAYASGCLLVDKVPQVHQLFTQVWSVTPHWLVEAIAAIGPVIAFYKSSNVAE